MPAKTGQRRGEHQRNDKEKRQTPKNPRAQTKRGETGLGTGLERRLLALLSDGTQRRVVGEKKELTTGAKIRFQAILINFN